MNNVMLDLETLDTRSTGVILSIGAVMFDKEGVGAEFYRTIDAQSCFDAGLTVSGGTFKWWMAQSAQARKALFEDNAPLQAALFAFTAFLDEHSTGDPKIWGNGSDFDNAMLAHAYNKLGLEVPWSFWNNRCYRTVCALHGAGPRVQEGVHHNALDDARSQAKHLIEVLGARGLI